MSIQVLRKKIDALDGRIVNLLNDRARLSLTIGKEKIRKGKAIYAADRERQVLDRVKLLSKGPLKSDALAAVYREIMSGSLALEKPLRIAYLGPQASFTELAARRKFGSQVEYVSCANLANVFEEVENGHCDYGVVPIENSIEGAVTHTFDLLIDSDLKICSQVLLEISHNLLSKTTLGRIKKVYSKPEVFGQCRNWLRANLPNAEYVPTASTTMAAQIVKKESHSACIASSLAAKVYGLRILKNDIEDVAHNITRFFVLANEDVPPTGRDRTSILFSIKDRVGALHAMLVPFARNGVNLTKIESRPSRKKAWDYYFFVDFAGHRDDPRVRRTLKQLEDMCHYIKILGSYPEVE